MPHWQDVPNLYPVKELVGVKYEQKIKTLVNSIKRDKVVGARILDMDQSPHTWSIAMMLSFLGLRVKSTVEIDQADNACGYIAAEAQLFWRGICVEITDGILMKLTRKS